MNKIVFLGKVFFIVWTMKHDKKKRKKEENGDMSVTTSTADAVVEVVNNDQQAHVFAAGGPDTTALGSNMSHGVGMDAYEQMGMGKMLVQIPTKQQKQQQVQILYIKVMHRQGSPSTSTSQ